MKATEVHVESPKGKQTILVPAGTAPRLTDLLRHEGLPLNTRCGERGLCDGCVVELLRGKLVRVETGAVVEANGAAGGASGDGGAVAVRGCEYRVPTDGGTIALQIPARSLLAHEPSVVTDFRINVPFAQDPLFVGPTPRHCNAWALGVAVDIGTTTVALLLVDLATGKVLSQAAGFNRQMHLGDDVVTRINLCTTEPAMLARLQEAVIQRTIAPLLAKALNAANASAHDLAGFTFAGNTTMLHLAAGVDPTPLGVAPFTPRFLEHKVVSAAAIHLAIHETVKASAAAEVQQDNRPSPQPSPSEGRGSQSDPAVHLLPGAAAYVGADLVAGILASGLAYDDGPSLLVDVGTNGEIILKHDGKLWGCATAAGPAFEGARLTSGIRAGHGAISRVGFTADPFTIHTEVIGNERPIGLCGSAYVDFLAQARSIGLIGPTGRFDAAAVPGAAAHLTNLDDGTLALRLAATGARRDLLVSETDIASLLQAKAAIAAGILTLLALAKLAPADVKRVYLAGGFGMHLIHEHAIGCGLLPGFTPAQVQVVGNSSLAGAYLALVDRNVLAELRRIGQALTVVELNLDPGFEERYIDQLMLP